jgi:protein arginine N-methyltransferase 1
MYSITDYGAMIADKVRMNAFVTALRQAIKPGTVVLDIGTGTGIFALLACRFGARRVYAVEPDDAIQVARDIAAANGYADRIEFIQALSTEVSLPERADVVVADIGGVLPWFQHHIPSIADARRRLLAPGGVLIPQRDTAWAAVVDAPELYERFERPWTTNGFGLDMDAARRLAINTWRKGEIAREHLLAEPVRWATVDYAAVEDPDVRACLSWTVMRGGTAHGFGAGFDRTLAHDVYLSNAPDAPYAIRPERIYGTIFFPWSAPVGVAAGDVVTVELEARFTGDDYIWNWKTRVLEQGAPARQKASFTQSTFLGMPLSRAHLQKRAASHVPTLNADGQVARFVLDAMAGNTSLGEIASQISIRFPSRFPRWEDALGYVGDLSRKYG